MKVIPCKLFGRWRAGFGRALMLPTLAATAWLGLNAQAQTNVFINPALGWQGFMNVFDLNYGYVFGSGWGTADLSANFNGSTLSLTPNSIGDASPFWYNPAGGPGATGNKIMDASFYVEDNNLAGQTVTFSGYCWGDTLVATNDHCTAFIKDFAPDYSSNVAMTTNLTKAGFFSITLATTPGDHIQFGFETIGPCWWSTDVGSKGAVVVSSNPPPAGPIITSITANPYVTVTSNLTLNVSATGSGTLTYQWRKNGINLTNGPGVSGVTTTALTLASVTPAAEASYSVVVKDSLNQTNVGSTYVVVFDPNNLSFDSHANLLGYINVFGNNGGTPGGYITGYQYPTANLRGSANNGVATLQPNISIYNPNDALYANPDGSPAAFLEQDYYIQNDGLAGNTLTFNGYCSSNNLDSSYTASAWVTDFAPDYSSSTTITTNLTAGQPFSLVLATSPGDHIQYGLRLFGPDNSPTNVITSGLVQVTATPLLITVGRTGSLTTLNFLANLGQTYTVQYKTNLTDAAWSTLTAFPGAGGTTNITDTTTATRRFYRVSYQ
ncbi:MAG TPA: immunoglobulin domain-containing protein [Verrucomicrobiae bacterium]